MAGTYQALWVRGQIGIRRDNGPMAWDDCPAEEVAATLYAFELAYGVKVTLVGGLLGYIPEGV